jgi:hypothetical protein
MGDRRDMRERHETRERIATDTHEQTQTGLDQPAAGRAKFGHRHTQTHTDRFRSACG